MRAKTPILIALALGAYLTPLAAQDFLAPDLINYEGRLIQADGMPLPDGGYDVEFRIYDAPAAGNLLWGPQEFDSEPGTGHGPKVASVDGRFSAVLGTVDSFNANILIALQVVSVAGGTAYLELTVEGSTLAPRQLLLSTPFAIVAANGFPRGSIVMWFGGAVPAGWAFCDGTLATPDLRSRFVKGAISGAIGPFAPGGSAAHSHTPPNHNHSISHTHGVSHNHPSISHSHSANPPNTVTNTVTGTQGLVGGLANFSFTGSHNHTADVGNTGTSASAPNTGFSSISITGGATVSVTNSTTPTDQDGSSIPVHYKLAFIMKL